MLSLSAVAQDDVEAELRFIAGLNDIGFADYAERALEQIRSTYPPDVVQRAEIKVLGAQGKLDEIQALIDKRPDANSPATWRLKLELAEFYYAWSQPEKFYGLYGAFIERFGKNPPAGMEEFVIQNVYRYAQFLLIMGQTEKAAIALRTVHTAAKKSAESLEAASGADLANQQLAGDAIDASYVQRQMAVELAELLVTVGEKDEEGRAALFKEAATLAKDVQWQEVDIWFGRSVVVLAHMRVVQGNRKGARDLIKMYMDELTAVHAAIKEAAAEMESDELLRLTPLAQCRYILGVMHHEDALDLFKKADDEVDGRKAAAMRQKAIDHLIGAVVSRGGKKSRSPNAALKHLYNVFVKYPTTQWAVDAGKRSNAIIDLLAENDINVKLGKVDMTEVVNVQFREARAKLQQNDFATAVEKFLDVLTLFPEFPSSVDALGELGRAYAELGRHDEARMVAEYLADRFCSDEPSMLKAGDTVARLARTYTQLELTEQADALNEFFFSRFPEHPQVHISMFRRGEEYFQDEMSDKALDYFLRLTEMDTKPSNYLDALYRAGLCYIELEELGDALKMFNRYLQAIEDDGPRQAAIDVRYRMADIYRKSGRNDLASSRYHSIVKILTGDERSKYEVSTSENEKNEKVLEGALFYRALSTSRRMKVPPRIPAGRPKDPAYWQKQYKLLGIKYYEEFLQKLPRSGIVPDVLVQLAALYLSVEKIDQAEATLMRLQRDYRGTDAALRALFQYATILKELGRDREAQKIYKQMFEGDAEYPPTQILEAGKQLFVSGNHQIALDAFRSVLKRSKDDAVLERALLWKGKAELQLKQFSDAAATLEALFQKHPRSAYTIEAAFALGASHAELGSKQADPAMKDQHFDKAYKAIKKVYTYAKGTEFMEQRARADIELANIQMLSGEEDKALGSYMRSWMLLKPNDPAHRKYKELAYSKAMPMVAKRERWDEVLDASEQYLQLYPRGDYARDADRWLTQAKMNAAESSAPEPEPEPEAVPEGDASAAPEGGVEVATPDAEGGAE